MHILNVRRTQYTAYILQNVQTAARQQSITAEKSRNCIYYTETVNAEATNNIALK